MKHILTGLSLISAWALLALAVGCASSTPTANEQNMLIAAGFKTITPRDAAQQQKPPSAFIDYFGVAVGDGVAGGGVKSAKFQVASCTSQSSPLGTKTSVTQPLNLSVLQRWIATTLSPSIYIFSIVLR